VAISESPPIWLYKVGCRRSSAANKNRFPRTIPEEGGPIPLHRDTMEIYMLRLRVDPNRIRDDEKNTLGSGPSVTGRRLHVTGSDSCVEQHTQTGAED